MAKSKEEQIFVGIDEQVIELTGADKEAFIKEREELNAMFANQKALKQAKEEARKSAMGKLKALGLTDDEISALVP